MQLEDVTSRFACFGLWGPAAREILQPLTDADLSFPYMRAQEIVGRPRAVPRRARHLRRASSAGSSTAPPSSGGACGTASGRPARGLGLVAGGYKAIDSLRLEKGYRVWGADISPEDTPYEAGLGFAVKPDKGEFVGREALAAAPEPERRLVCIALEDPRSVALGSEPVRIDGEIAGRVTSGGYGYTVERSIAYAYVPSEAAGPGQEVEVEIFGEWIAGEVAEEPLFDPSGERIRA